MLVYFSGVYAMYGIDVIFEYLCNFLMLMLYLGVDATFGCWCNVQVLMNFSGGDAM